MAKVSNYMLGPY